MSPGDGRSISHFVDRWVPSVEGYRVLPRETSSAHVDVKVIDWIDSGSCMSNEATVMEAVQQRDAEAVLQMTIQWDRIKDFVWFL